MLAGLAGCTWTWRSEAHAPTKTLNHTLRATTREWCQWGLTCDFQGDGVGGGPPPQGLVRLKPEVVVARITQPHHPDLDRAAGVAAPDVAGTKFSHLLLHTFLDFGCRFTKWQFVSPSSPTVGQADLVGIRVVSELPATL